MKKRMLSILLCLCVVLCLLPMAALADTADEHPDWSSAMTYDSDSSTYTVLSADGLRWISGVSDGTITADTYQNDPDVPLNSNFDGCTVKLGAAIDLSGADWTPIQDFAGTFDGAGYHVTGMKVQISGTDSEDSGFFGSLSGTVRNLSVGGSITGRYTGSGSVNAGGIAGKIVDSGLLCNSEANVDTSLTGDNSGTVKAGGLVGFNNSGSICNCVTTGAGHNICALVCRTVSGTITNCYSSSAAGCFLIYGGSKLTTLNSAGMCDADGTLHAYSNTLDYGTELNSAVRYWIYRQDDADIPNYVTWTTDTIPALTTEYAQAEQAHTSTPGDWQRQADGGYTRVNYYTGLNPQSAEASVTSGGTETPYETLEKAITAAQGEPGSTVKLLTDVTTDHTVDIGSGTFTIDLNGKTWTSTECGTEALDVSSGAQVILKDGAGGGTFTWKTSDPSVLDPSKSAVSVWSASVTIDSGTYRCSGGHALFEDKSDVTINGGTFDGEALFGYCKNVSIRSGTFSSITVVANGSSHIKNVGGLLADGYVYRSTESGNAWVSDVSGTELTNVSVQAVPVRISAQPQDAAATYGYADAPTLNVTAVPVPADSGKAVTCQWYSVGTGTGGTDEAISESAAGAHYTVPTGLAVGTYRYYCAVTCDDYTLQSATVTVTVNTLTGAVANRTDGSGYNTSYTYSGRAVTVPTGANFTANGGTEFTFTWYSGQNTDGSVTGLTQLFTAPVDAGTYTLKADVAATPNVSAASTTVTVTVNKADPSTGAVTYGGGTLYTSTNPGSVTLTRSNTDVAGTLKLDGVTALTAGTNHYNWEFTPDDPANYNVVTGTISLDVTQDALQSISIGTTTPDKTSYTYGDVFDTTGLTVTATYLSGLNKDVTASVTMNALAVGDTSVTLSYTEDGVTKTCEVSGLTVNKKSGNDQTASVTVNYANTQAQTVDVSEFIPSDCGTINEIAVEISDPHSVIAAVSGDKSAKIVSYNLTSGLTGGGQSATLTATVKTQNYADFTVTITVNTTNKTGVTITGLTAQDGTYNGRTQTGYTGTPSSSYTGDYEITYIGRNGTAYSGATVPKNAGDYTVTFQVPDSDPTYCGSTSVDFTIGKATVIATADSKSMTTGGTLTAFTVSYSGIASGDTADSIFAAKAAASCTADGKTAGSYPITATTPVLTTTAARDYTVVSSVNGTLTVSNPSYNGGGDDSSSDNTTTVPISSGTDQISASVTVSGSNATVSVTDAQAKAIAFDAKTMGTVKLDVSEKKADSVVVPSKLVSAVDGAALEVSLPTGTVSLDKTALAAVKDKGDVKLSVKTTDNSKLTETQKAALGSQSDTATVVDVNLCAGGSKISTFGGGKLSISIPYTLKSGESADSITVWFLKDDGTIEPKNGAYANGRVTFVTEHLSEYLIVSFPFTDVAENAWCYDGVAYAYNHGLFSGTSAATFSPSVAMTRQMIWMVLARMDGKTPASMDEAKAWAVENKISDGTNPTNSITREQLAAILYRYLQYKGYDTTQGGMAVREFSDYDSISEYAQPALAWAVNAGLVQGSGNQLMPAGRATRAQVAVILKKFIKNVTG